MTSSITHAPQTSIAAAHKEALVHKGATLVTSSPVLGLSQVKMKEGKLRCSLQGKATTGMSTGTAALAAASMVSVSAPALALVDERLSTEGTGLSLGLSNNLLGWILLGVFALIWSLYFVYTSTLEEDDDSGLSL